MALELSGTNKITHDNLNQNIKDLLTPKNWIINGGFDVWQRGTSQTSSGYGSDDRWISGHSVSTKTHSRQAFTIGQTDVPNNPTYFSRTVVTTGNTSSSVVQKQQYIEDVTKLAGKTISLSFWAKADSSKNIAIEFGQAFGTGGSTYIPSQGVQKFALTTSWQRFTKTLTLPSVSGKTIGTGNFTFLNIWFDAGSDFNSRTDSLGNQSGTFDIANVSLVEGSTPVEWQTEAYADVLRQCQRYYWRSSSLGTNYKRFCLGIADNTTSIHAIIQFPVKMRTQPSSIEWNAISSWTSASGLKLPFSGVTMVADANSDDNQTINLTGSSSLTANQTYFVIAYGTTSAYIAFSAEL